jgi:hypothetical protein
MADHQRGAGPLAQQFDKLAVQDIDSFSQFFERHSILVLRLTVAAAMSRRPGKLQGSELNQSCGGVG